MFKKVLFSLLMDYLKPEKLISLALWISGMALKEIGGLDYKIKLPKKLTDSFIERIQDGELTDEETGEFLIEISKRI